MGLISRVILSGSAASLLSAAAVALRSKTDAGAAFQGVNDTSHWIWGDIAFQQSRPTLRYTVPGFVIHHLSGIFWGFLFEHLLDRQLTGRAENNPSAIVQTSSPVPPRPRIKSQDICRTAALVSAIANIVDFKFTPQRLTPGFEQHLSRKSLSIVYLSFAAGLAAVALARQRKTPS